MTVALIVFTVLFVVAAPIGAGAADHPLLQELPDKDRAEKLKQAEESLRGKDRQGVIAFGAAILHEWLHYPTWARIVTDPGRAAPSAQALRDYQTKRRLKPTGVMDAPTLVRLTDDFDLIQKLQLTNAVRLPGSGDPLWGNVAGYEYVKADGTWVITNESSAFPLQTSEITCYRGQQKCEGTTVIFTRDGFVSVHKDEYKVLAWEHDGVRAASSSASCVDYVIFIRRVEETKPGTGIPGLVSGHRTVKADGRDLFGRPCEGMTPHLSLRLDMGYRVQQRYRNELWKALGFPATREEAKKP